MFETMTLVWVLFGSMTFLILSALLGGHHDVDAGHGTDHGVVTSELFNLRNLALIAAGFSACSILARNMGYGDLGVNLAGILGAVTMFLVGVYFFRMIRKQESNSITSNTSLIGRTATVTTGIPEVGFGEIMLNNALGTTTTLNAKSAGVVIPQGTEVRIKEVSGNIAIVTTLAA